MFPVKGVAFMIKFCTKNSDCYEANEVYRHSSCHRISNQYESYMNDSSRRCSVEIAKDSFGFLVGPFPGKRKNKAQSQSHLQKRSTAL